ncbi:MAG: bifunctional phosphopantothenoylcysteine decarboxylase/phosphopantothenate--cysteine ligase CoaBC [Candidatus Pacebacteria bacterium]|nr:bifunctional phosphopantothenoylcysteine decarboxylase/phosphopantothenate--cysteine ligase CoaBC [Candidatus Paceibacterota bacterium]
MTARTSHRGTVVLGVSSSIAAYKAADLTSKLVQSGVDVHVVMTQNATNLVRPQTFRTLSQHPVITDLWSVPDWRPEHIALAELAQVLVIAPATANVLAKLANGIADDALTTFALAHEGPLIVAPAMNPRMWRNPAVRENCRRLQGRGVTIVAPESGRVACGTDTEPGRLADVSRIVSTTLAHLAGLSLRRDSTDRQKILVTAGPTREVIDPVRFISNKSSGKMGYACAEMALAAGHDVTLISGPAATAPPPGCRFIAIESAADMAVTVRREFPDCNLLIMCAAVGDYRPATPAQQKIKKTKGKLTLTLERTEDILAIVASLRKPTQKVVGFAAETVNVDANAVEKLHAKKLDMIVANDVSRQDAGFGTDENVVTLYLPDGTKHSLPRMLKIDVAAEILRHTLPL